MKHTRLKHILGAWTAAACIATAAAGTRPFYTTGISVAGSGEIVLSQKGEKRVDLFSADGKQLLRSFPFDETPTGVTSAGGKIYVTTFESQGSLHIIDLATGATVTVPAGSGATSPFLSPDKKRVYVCNQFANTVSEIDPETGKVLREVRVLREPKGGVFSKDGKYIYVTNFLPAQRADVDEVCAAVSVIDTKNFTKAKDIRLANGSNALRGLCLTPDGKYLYVSHNLGRFTVPTSQLQQGWMNTSAFSVIDTEKQEFLGAVLVDEPDRGAAGIWGIACNDDAIFITHSGTHEVSVIDHRAFRKKFEAYPRKEDLNYDLTFLYGIRERIPLQGNGPRAMALTGDELIVPTYFSDILNVMDIRSHALASVALNPDREETDIDRGERYFNDASHCFQNWQSCNGCHPGDARTDGMNWDLMNDGVGNSKNCKSLLYSHPTPPSMISGIRASAEIAVRAGFRFIQFFDISEHDALCVDAYLRSLKAVPSPYLEAGRLSKKAEAGRKVFEKLGCGSCHSGPYYTDMKMHRIGENIEFENGWDTPTLREVWRTAPYLFDGRAATMNDVFEKEKHGINQKVSQKDIDALVEYVNSL